MSIVYAPAPDALVSITDITVGQDHNIWFSQSTSTIGRLTPGGDVTQFPLSPSVNIDPTGSITAGPDGNVWFALDNGEIGRITTSGEITYFTLPDSSAEVSLSAEGPDRAVWFTQNYPDTDLLNGLIWGTKFGRITV